MSTRKKFIANTGWIIAGRAMQAVLSFVMSILLARYLMPDNYGLLNYSASIIAMFSSFSALGFSDTGTMFLVEDSEHEGTVLGTMVVLRLLATGISALAVYVLIQGMNQKDPMLCAVAMLQMGGALFQAFGVFSNWFQSKLRSSITTGVTLITYTVVSVYKLMCLMNGKSLYWFAGSGILEYAVTALLLYYAYRKNGGQPLKFSLEYGKIMFRKSYHFIISGFMIIAYNQMDRVMLGSMISEASTGIYTVALNLCNSWTFLLGALINSATPIIYGLNHTNEELFARRLKQLNFVIVAVASTVALLITLFSKGIILIFYGTAYSRAIVPLCILSWFSVFQYLGYVRTTWAICKDQQKYEKWLSLCGLICNFVMNYTLIPSIDVVGASLATLCTQIVVNFAVPWFIPALRPYMHLTLDSLKVREFISANDVRNAWNSVKSAIQRKVKRA